MSKLTQFFTTRIFWAAFFMLLQLVVLILAVWFLSSKFYYFYGACIIISMVVVIWIMSKDDNASYKLAWAIPIAALPLFGGLFYLLFGNKKIPYNSKKKMLQVEAATSKYFPKNKDELELLGKQSRSAYSQARYLNDYASAPVYRHTQTEFQSPGEEHFPRLLEELEKAQRYIFMEYFIAEPGYMLDAILDVLGRKVVQGVDVRFLYDDVGSLFTAPDDFQKRLESRGIKVACFNKLGLRLQSILNNRDHRKITVIDGIVGFTGGVNLADEYINRKVKYGNWKDSALMLKGEAVWSFVVMFLQTWNLVYAVEDSDFSKYYPLQAELAKIEGSGFVAPYGDSPLDNEKVGENVYRNMIDKANEYLYIETPYFIIDDELMTSIELAAKAGVDVRVLVPHIPDKKAVFLVTQAYYPRLVKAGARVYEYTPGFVHAKACVSDDAYAAVGTVNFDYRSFYLHFECGVWMYASDAVMQVKEDFLATLELSQEISLAEIEKISAPKLLLQGVLRLFAPLM